MKGVGPKPPLKKKQYEVEENFSSDVNISDNEQSEHSDYNGKFLDQPKTNRVQQLKKKFKALQFKQFQLQRNLPIMFATNSFALKSIWTLIVIVFFINLVYLGHFYSSIFVFLVNAGALSNLLLYQLSLSITRSEAAHR